MRCSYSGEVTFFSTLRFSHLHLQHIIFLWECSKKSCNSHHIPKDKLITLLELELNNCVFSFQQKFYKQLQEADMGSAVSPVTANIYVEYFEELALGSLCPIPTPWWKRYVDDVIFIVKKNQIDILFNHIHQMDAHIKFTMEPPDSEGSIPCLNTKCSSTLIIPFTPQYIGNQHMQTDN